MSTPRLDEPSPPPEPSAAGTAPSTVLSGPAGNGLIAYSSDGDIHLGDPATGATRPITQTAEFEVNPIFSPDGSRIAFLRGEPFVDVAVVVTDAEGSRERVVFARSDELVPSGPFTWTPDGTSLVVGADRLDTEYWDGILAVVDAAGADERRLLTPPLPPSIGAMPWNASAQVAPMLRPREGEWILRGGEFGLREYRPYLREPAPLAVASLEPYEPHYIDHPVWSPDGTRIVFPLHAVDEPFREPPDLFVVDGDGRNLQHIGLGWYPQWSPDSSVLGYERTDGRPTPTRTLVLVDVTSGLERALVATTAEWKRGAPIATATNNVDHDWFYEAWSWSPDGRSLLVLERHGTRPWVVDVASGTVTSLPWASDSGPSWQRVPSD